MMRYIADFVIRFRKPILVLFAAFIVLGALGVFTLRVNYNMTDYLPPQANSTLAIDAMGESFGEEMPNTTVMLPVESVVEALEYKERIEAIEGVSSVVWLDDSMDLKLPLETQDEDTVETFYKDGFALYTVTIESGEEVSATDAIYALIGDEGAMTGNAVDNANSQKLALEQMISCAAIIAPLLMIVMVLATASWLEPFVYLIPVAISILLSFGMASMLGELCYVSMSVIPILQLAVALDYAVFLSTAYTVRRRETDDASAAMKQALVDSAKPIFASVLVAIFAFAALVFMDFGIGADMGWALVRGVIASYICIVALVPALTIMGDKLLQKTRHRSFMPSFKMLGNALVKARVPVLVIIALIAVPCFFAQSHNYFIYSNGDPTEGTRIARDTDLIGDTFGNETTLALLVPRGDSAAEKALSDEMKQLPGVKSVMSYATAVGNQIPPEYLGSLADTFYSDEYARIIAYTTAGKEGDAAFELVERVRESAAEHYGDGALLMCGESANMYDMMETVNEDGERVDLITVIAILIVLALIFRSLILPVIAVITIKVAIFINMALPYFLGSELSYIGYLVISVVMMGSAIDYGILLIDHYLEARRFSAPLAAMRAALPRAIPAMIVSAAVLAIAGFALAIAATEPLVSALGMLLGRGAIIAFIMSITFLPGLLILCDPLIPRLSFGLNYFKDRKKDAVVKGSRAISEGKVVSA